MERINASREIHWVILTVASNSIVSNKSLYLKKKNILDVKMSNEIFHSNIFSLLSITQHLRKLFIQNLFFIVQTYKSNF